MGYYEPEYSSFEDAEERRRDIARLRRQRNGRIALITAVAVVLFVLAVWLLT